MVANILGIVDDAKCYEAVSGSREEFGVSEDIGLFLWLGERGRIGNIQGLLSIIPAAQTLQS